MNRVPAAAAALLVAALFCAGSASAQQAVPGDRQAVPQQLLKLQPPAPDFAASPARSPGVARGAGEKSECAPAWPCRLRLFGVIDKTGGVGLKGPVLSW